MNKKRIVPAIIAAIIVAHGVSASAVEVEYQNSYEEKIGQTDSILRLLQSISDDYIIKYPDKVEEINNIMSEYYQNDEFRSEFNDSNEAAAETYSRALDIEMEIKNESSLVQPYGSTVIGGGLGVLYYCYVDSTIMQEETDWCGVASTQMVLSGVKRYDSSSLPSGFVLPEQSEIATEVMGTNGAVVYKIKNYLNSLLSNKTYTYKQITSSVTKSDIQEYIMNSLNKNRPVILHAVPYVGMDYYSSMSNYRTGHYLVVEEYSTYTDTYTISDCTYLTRYQGRHEGITIDEIYNSLYNPSAGVTGRYIIYA